MLIAGAKGFAKELLTVFSEQPREENWVFFDDITPELPPLLYDTFRIIRTLEEAKSYFIHASGFALGVGNPGARLILYNKLSGIGGTMISLISSKAIISPFENNISQGVTILANVVIESENQIAEGTLIHVGALVSHECRIGRFCEISPAAQLLGNVTVGDQCSIGAGAVILPKIRLGNNVTVGAGAVVTKDVEDNCVVAGVPAKHIG